jgi:hypothetical protein
MKTVLVRWPTIRKNTETFLAKAQQAGMKVDYLDLPATGVKGNSHMMMMDRNSDAIAGHIQQWLEKNGWTQR